MNAWLRSNAAPGLKRAIVEMDLEVTAIETTENEMADEATKGLWDSLLTSAKMVDAFEKETGRPMTEHDRTLAITLFLQRNGKSNGAAAPAKKKSGGQSADVECPQCGGPMWDNRESKRSPKAPDYKCKDKDNCDGAIWLDSKKPARQPQPAGPAPDPFDDRDDGLPF